jgi:hypothetical protein
VLSVKKKREKPTGWSEARSKIRKVKIVKISDNLEAGMMEEWSIGIMGKRKP